MKLSWIGIFSVLFTITNDGGASLLTPLQVLSKLPNLLAQPLSLNQQIPSLISQNDQSIQYRYALYGFSLNLYSVLSDHVNDHFVTSPLSIWMALAALAEGAEPQAQAQILKVLGLPQQYSQRQKFYDIALSLETSGRDVTLRRHRGIVFDQNVQVNQNWANFVMTTKLIEYVSAPLKANPKLAETNLRQAIGSRLKMPLQGNSVIVDSLTYKGLWTYAFDAAINTEPFYDESGHQIGTVPMMRIKLQTRMVDLPQFNAKVVELPVGYNGRYGMLIGLGMEHTGFMRKIANLQQSKLIDEVINLLHMTLGPIEIGIPKISMKTDYDARVVLEQMGLTDIWTDPASTSYVSSPPALPGGLVQRVTISLGPEGILPPPYINIANGILEDLNTLHGRNFIANKPFTYVLFETKTLNILFCGAYSDPNKR